MPLSQISHTAILTLISRVVASQKRSAEFPDPMAAFCLDRLLALVSGEERAWMLREKRIYSGSQSLHALAGARRSQVYDNAASRFIHSYPGCTVVSLGCGFDTRFWRIPHKDCRYVELDLPEVIALKREALKDQLTYELIGSSVLDESWIDQVTSSGTVSPCPNASPCPYFLFLAEGLFPYIPESEMARLLQLLAQRFVRSQLVLDIVPVSYTKGILKKLFALEMRINWGLEDVPWVFGLKNPRQLESYAPGLKVIGTEKGSAGPVITVAINAG